ncbi:MAG: transposase family protein [Solirubrobacterales bacterium]|nr:transposase family protein [Solirubrobacterales bacterium]
MRAFHQRIAARRGSNIATARKLVLIAWHLLSRGQAYAFARPALVREEIRRLELRLGLPPHQGRSATGRAHPKAHQRQAEHAVV